MCIRDRSWAQYSIVWVPVPVTTTLLLALPAGAGVPVGVGVGVPVGVGVGVGVGVMRAWQLAHAPRFTCDGGGGRLGSTGASAWTPDTLIAAIPAKSSL